MGVAALAGALGAGVAAAHPLGNFTINTYSGLVIGPAGISVEVVVDMAEIPALQAKQSMGVSPAGIVSPAEAQSYRTAQCQQIRDQVTLRLGGAAVPLTLGATTMIFPPGQAGLTTLRSPAR